MTTRRQILLAGVLAALTTRTFAQSRPALIGILLAIPLKQSVLAPIVLRRLAELGYENGKGATFLVRSADGTPERFPRLARELVEAKCDLIFAIGPEQAPRALKIASQSIPVVFFANDFDPLQAGVVQSLARTGSNITGVYVPEPELVAKRFQIMREALPKSGRMLLFVDTFSRDQLGAARKAAAATGFQLAVVEFAKAPYDLPGALDDHAGKVDALMILTSPNLFAQLEPLRPRLAKHQIPSIGTGGYVARGVLFGFGAASDSALRRTAEMGVEILKGAKPASIPVEQSREYEFRINSKVASEVGLTIPGALLARATRIIQ
jgi:putative tryptophan/tyrosine transport system substrate-binding protein